MNKLHIKRDDTVVVLSGKDKGKKGKVLETSPKEQKVIVEGINMVTKHVKPRRQGETGGIVKAEENAVVAKILAAPQTADATHPAVAKTGAAAGAINDFVAARALLSSAAEDLVIICTPAQYATYRGLQMAANYGVDPFDGLEVLFNDTVTAPIIGDLSGVLMNTPKGEAVQIKYDDMTRKKEDMVEILGRHPAAIEVVGNLFFAKVAA